MRKWTLFSIGVLAAMGLAACAELNPDINRVQPPYTEKELMVGSWYFKKTVIDTAPGNQWASQGDGDWLTIERIRWKITQGYLYGYRDWEYIPGSETAEWEGSDYFGSPVIMYAIKEHFDIKRSYNAQTGEETNVTDKNIERPWNERKYMVVDWSQNLAPTIGLTDWYFYIPISQITSNAYYVQSHEIDNPDRARIGKDYIDIVGKYTVWPDLMGCNFFYDAYDCAPGEIHVRHSFSKVPENHDYEIMAYPDSVDLVDASGDYVRDTNGNVKRIKIFERFGDFRVERLTYDGDYGHTESGRIYRAGRFNLWEKSFDKNGEPIPYHNRVPKPVVYYMNVEFPDDEDMSAEFYDKWNLKKAGYKVGENWNGPFRETVAMLRVMSRNGNNKATAAEIQAELANVPDMFIVKDNDCNIKNLEKFIDKHEKRAEFEDALNEYLGGRQRIEKKNLAKACTIVESLSAGTDKEFTWQRHGDNRYSMLMYVPKWIEAGWVGLGPPFADPVTGEYISATAHYAGPLAETAITRIMDYIDAINGEITDFDVVTGQDVSRYVDRVRRQARQDASAEVSSAVVSDMNRRFRKMGDSRERLLKEITPNYAMDRLKRIQGTPLEDLVVGEPDWQVARFMNNHATAAGVDEQMQLTDLVSPARKYRRELPLRRLEKDLRAMRHGRCPISFYDESMLHSALLIKDLPREERRAIMRYLYFEAVMTHEVGHNIGMTHNFAASIDPLNYVKGFWDIQELPEDLDSARTALVAAGDDDKVQKIDLCLADRTINPDRFMTTQHCLGGWEMKYASIMDYTHYNPVGDFAGLGMYDKAFVYFVYGGVVEAFNEDAIDRTVLGTNGSIEDWLWQHDYKNYPNLFTQGKSGIYDRSYHKISWGPSQTTMDLPAYTVPYEYCSEYRANRTPNCGVRDYGSNMSEIVETELKRYKEYYFFNHFNRGQTNYYWFQNAMYSDQLVMRKMLTIFQYMYLYRAIQPDFFSTETGEDFLRASLMGINLFAEIIGTPPNGRFMELDAEGGMLIASQRDGYWRVEPTEDWIGGTTPGLPTTGGAAVAVERGYFNECDEQGAADVMEIPLGAGRPFALGYTPDYEEWVFSYIGSYFAKDDALYLLAYPQATYMPYQYVSGEAAMDPRTYSVNFFRLFREEILNTYYGVISGDMTRFAPVFRKNGDEWIFEARKFADASGALPEDYYKPGEDVKLVSPSMAYNIPYNALLYGMALMSNLLDTEEDFTHIAKIAVKGQEDDIGDFDRIDMYDTEGVQQKAEFTHPLTGVTYRALRQSETPIGFFMVEEANRRKARWQELQSCLDDPTKDTGLCSCTYQSQEVQDGYYTCPARETVGCDLQDRVLRTEKALEFMERQVELMDNMRLFHSIFEYNL